MPTTAFPRSDVHAGDQAGAPAHPGQADRRAQAMTPTLVFLLVSVERRIGDLAAVVARAEDDEKAVEAITELRRISETLHGALHSNAP